MPLILIASEYRCQPFSGGSRGSFGRRCHTDQQRRSLLPTSIDNLRQKKLSIIFEGKAHSQTGPHLAHIKYVMFQGYMKAVKAKLAETKPERVEAFEKGAAAYAKKIVANFKDFEFVSRIWIVHKIFTILTFRLVHWREHEPRRHDRSTELPCTSLCPFPIICLLSITAGRWHHPYVHKNYFDDGIDQFCL